MLSIQIILEKKAYHLGEPLPISVVYRNAGSSSVKREDPSQSLNIEMHVIDRKTREDFNYTMGKIEVTQFGEVSDEYAIIEPIPGDIEIEAQTEFTFVTDLNQRLYLGPGGYDCELREHAMVSNKEAVSIWYTRDSIVLLFNLVSDSTLDYSRREWAADWLREVVPNFNIKLALDTDSDAVKSQYESANILEYKRFQQWWEANRDSKKIRMTLESINGRIN